MVKTARRLNDAFSEFLTELVVSPLGGQSLPQKDKKRKKRKGENKFKKKQKAERRRSPSRPKTQNFDLCACPSKHVVKRGASGRHARGRHAIMLQMAF